MTDKKSPSLADADNIVISKKGYEIDICAEPIVLPVVNGNRYLYVDKLKDYFGAIFLQKFRIFLRFILQRQSVETAISLFDGINWLIAVRSADDRKKITNGLLHRFKAAADKEANKHPCRKLRQWLLWDWETSTSPMLSLEQVALVRKWKFKDIKPYAAIREGRDGVGPLSRMEDLKLQAALKHPTTDRFVGRFLTDYQVATIIAILRKIGVRPTQISYTKQQDLKVWEHDGHRVGFLLIPDVKDGEAPRANFRKHRLPEELLEMIERAILDRNEAAVGDWLFPRAAPLMNTPPGAPPEEAWRARSIDQAISSWIERRGLTSVGGVTMKANPRRIRYTFATELAPRMSPLELAYALGHSDPRSVMHYFTYSDGFYARLSTVDGATKWGLAAASFAGKISDAPLKEAHGGVVFFGGELHLESTDIIGVGRCGAQVRCKLFPPMSCYGCSRFRPDPDADHASVLETLVNWRAKRPGKVGKRTDPLQGQLDDVIEAAGYLVGILPAYHWVRDRLRAGLSQPTIEEIASETGVSDEILAKDQSIQALLEQWPVSSRGAGRIAARRKNRD
ncbi:tyrosine-type recombinase/integrase [Novosphingobium panipatense]|uniref:tyrosine-type recombinase/integrase n=1 Tax=Novosphingobium panipatense TaxID=428991 RepID=UPI0039A1A1BD